MNNNPVHIGELLGVSVWLDVKQRVLYWGGSFPSRFDIDHPYIKGTKLQEVALKLLERAEAKHETG